MRAMVLREFGKPVRLEEVPRPRPGPGEVLIAVKACGTGLTLRWAREGRMPGITLPRIIGHEVGGVVVEVGPGVTRFKPGERVTVQFYLVCGHCKFCRIGRETLCTNLKGVIGAAIDGGYAEYLKVPEANVIPIPEGVGFAGRESPRTPLQRRSTSPGTGRTSSPWTRCWWWGPGVGWASTWSRWPRCSAPG